MIDGARRSRPSGDVLLQTPVDIFRTQFYGTTGGGAYRSGLASRQETHVGTNIGGGAKIRLFGPLRVRSTTASFGCRRAAAENVSARFYAGANLVLVPGLGGRANRRRSWRAAARHVREPFSSPASWAQRDGITVLGEHLGGCASQDLVENQRGPVIRAGNDRMNDVDVDRVGLGINVRRFEDAPRLRQRAQSFGRGF